MAMAQVNRRGIGEIEAGMLAHRSGWSKFQACRTAVFLGGWLVGDAAVGEPALLTVGVAGEAI